MGKQNTTKSDFSFISRYSPFAIRYSLVLLTSLLLIASCPKFNQGWLAWFALAPLVISILSCKTLKAAVLCGFGSGFFFYLGLLYWIYPTMRAGGVEPAFSALGLILLAALLALEFLLVSGFGFYLKKAGAGVFPYVFAAAWVVMEWAKISVNYKAAWFPWFTLAYTQWQYGEIIQIVSVTGLYGLSFAVCFSGALAGALMYQKRKPLKVLLGSLPALALFSGLWLYGDWELKKADSVVFQAPLKASLLQPSIDLYAKWDAGQAAAIEEKINGLIKGIGKTDLIVWPENALPGWIEDKHYGGWVSRVAKEKQTANFVGSVSRGDGKRVAAFLVDLSGTITAEYYKRVLVPFGEYVPLRDFLGRYIKPVAALGEFLPGKFSQPLMEVRQRESGTASERESKSIKISGVICYESIFPFLFRQDAAKGAEIFVNITNDGWYLNTAAPYQHLLVNIFRAVETRRPVLRAANNGISAYIDPWGGVQRSLGLNRAGVLDVEVKLAAEPVESFYVRYGDLFVNACIIICAAFLLAVLVA
ncbi:MAG: apolipoprotein N-acyltransferase [Elusimicrobia bacterium GWF2_52_66]|nr:MAG: apolipoprotein N-acyltransferase [Elusimicrobia bacterium GWA2_51_34]OGR86431.1 MAG: apolipoprotein N-acyltransferase [Elusimicrobia bacterium GWF2_52_66]HAF96149.1 apolipoprotein N-acyltransferase [Elusimicrobiota bacterium]HCE97759.1 apolipoprotein N-acyltransferase [Elusimicrobiota bacterium]